MVSGGQVMANLLEILPDLEKKKDIKIVAVTSPQLYEELRRTDPEKADAILSDGERQYVTTLHNGWAGFLYPFLLPADHPGASSRWTVSRGPENPTRSIATPASTRRDCGNGCCNAPPLPRRLCRTV